MNLQCLLCGNFPLLAIDGGAILKSHKICISLVLGRVLVTWCGTCQSVPWPLKSLSFRGAPGSSRAMHCILEAASALEVVSRSFHNRLHALHDLVDEAMLTKIVPTSTFR